MRQRHNILAPKGTGLILGALSLVCAPGCVGLWDEVTSNHRDLRAFFFKPDPLVVLRDSNDGQKRAAALASLKEPIQNGGTAADQEVFVKILTTAATNDAEPLCRLGAIRALADFKDPRAPRALEEAFIAATTRKVQGKEERLSGEFVSVIRQQALASLEKAGDAGSRHLLIRVARQPSGAVDASLIDRQQTLDERLTAVRALAKYKQADAIETLIYVMESEKDIALKDRAHQSLQTATGKSLPADAQAWRDLISRPPDMAQQEPNFIQRVSGIVTKKQ